MLRSHHLFFYFTQCAEKTVGCEAAEGCRYRNTRGVNTLIVDVTLYWRPLSLVVSICGRQWCPHGCLGCHCLMCSGVCARSMRWSLVGVFPVGVLQHVVQLISVLQINLLCLTPLHCTFQVTHKTAMPQLKIKNISY